MIFTLQLYRENNRWFFDDVRKNIEHEEFVGGIPEMIYAILGTDNAKKLSVDVSTTEIMEAVVLTHVDKLDPFGGVFYSYTNDTGEVMEGWLCPVIWNYFKPPLAPKKLWVRVVILASLTS